MELLVYARRSQMYDLPRTLWCFPQRDTKCLGGRANPCIYTIDTLVGASPHAAAPSFDHALLRRITTSATPYLNGGLRAGAARAPHRGSSSPKLPVSRSRLTVRPCQAETPRSGISRWVRDFPADPIATTSTKR